MASPRDTAQVTAVEQNGFYPVVLSGFRNRDWHDLATRLRGSTGVTVALCRALVIELFGSGLIVHPPAVLSGVWLLADAVPPGRVQFTRLKMGRHGFIIDDLELPAPEQSVLQKSYFYILVYLA